MRTLMMIAKMMSSNKGNNDDYDDNDDSGDRGDWAWVRIRVRIDWQPTS